ncbi:hypothetical protein C8R43DRAFT_949470 [Mycena crocata]|nr:hypothetical protein C8R43DRAFT_949470 [Mycena crocata]
MRRSSRLVALRSLPSLPATTTVLGIAELYGEILGQLTISDLAKYRVVAKQATIDFQHVLAHRVRHYTRPFFPKVANWDVFFIQLRIRETWIVGSAALAVVSMPSKPLPPANLNAIAPYFWYGYWLKLMTDSFGFQVDADTGKVVTITFARESNVYDLFVCGGNTNQIHAITAKEVVCTDIKGASQGEAVRGWWHQLKEQDALWSPPAAGMQFKSPFPNDVTLFATTEGMDRDCGWACPGRPRVTSGLQGIGHWPWGRHDGSGGLCSSVRDFGRSRLKWKTGDHCKNPKYESVNSLVHADFNSDFKSPVFGQWAIDESAYVDAAGETFRFFVFGQVMAPVQWEDAHRRLRIECPTHDDPRTVHAFGAQIKTLTSAVREDDDLDCDKSLNMDIRLCTDAVKRRAEDGTWIELHVDHVGAGRALLFCPDPSREGELLQTMPLTCADWPLRKGDIVLVEATLHKRESFTFETRVGMFSSNYEILSRNIRLLLTDPTLCSDKLSTPGDNFSDQEIILSPGEELSNDVEITPVVETGICGPGRGGQVVELCSIASRSSLDFMEDGGHHTDGTLTDSSSDAAGDKDDSGEVTVDASSRIRTAGSPPPDESTTNLPSVLRRLRDHKIQRIADLQYIKLQFRRDVPYKDGTFEAHHWVAWRMLYSEEEKVLQPAGGHPIKFPQSDPSAVPYHPRRIHDKYKDYDVRIMKGMHKGLYGRVLSTTNDSKMAQVRLRGGNLRPHALVPVKYLVHEHSGLDLDKAVNTAPEILAGKRAAREQMRAAIALPTFSIPEQGGPIPADLTWEALINLPSAVSPSEPTPLTPAPVVPDDWLRHPYLRGAWLDVRCVCPDTYYKGIYNNRVGVIEGLPAVIKAGDRGVAEVKFAPFSETTVRKVKVKYLVPVCTTELPGVIAADAAKPMAEVQGVQVVVIGPDKLGRWNHVGMRGWIMNGGIQFQGLDGVIDFPIQSVLIRTQSTFSHLLSSMPPKKIPFYRNWEGNEGAPIDVEVGSSEKPVDLDAWLDAAAPAGPATVRKKGPVKQKTCTGRFACIRSATGRLFETTDLRWDWQTRSREGWRRIQIRMESSLFEFMDSSSSALADAQLYHGYSWEIIDYRTSYAREHGGYEAYPLQVKPPMTFDVFGIVRGMSVSEVCQAKDGSIILGKPRWHSEGSAGSALTVKYHQQLAAISRGLEGLRVPAFLDNEEIVLSCKTPRSLPVGAVVIATATFFVDCSPLAPEREEHFSLNVVTLEALSFLL